ncbi:MAG TPA: 2-oxoglutarate dehydrogenase complex dihydrolipoyllysine-residue succinyltransferase [Terriglobia bacterium]|nr:2-oxoglutarate dehydrogenase complex dihydrolipoyllysine-residue succinyltransferase [Terriglobia bacterium]
MSIRIVVPELGESVLEATVGHWLKHEGDSVNAGEVLVSLETDKVDLEVGAERSGVLARIERQEGDDVKIGDVLGLIDESAAAQPGTSESAGAQTAAPPPSAPQRASAPAAPEPGQGPAEAPAATPSARRLARERDIDLSKVTPANGGGRVTKEDVERHLGRATKPAPAASSTLPVPPKAVPGARTASPAVSAPARAQRGPSAPDTERREERVRMSRRRQTIARRLVEAQHAAAMLTTFNEADMGAVQELRKRHKESFQERHGVGLGIASFFVKACVAALRAFPRLNSEVDGDEIVLKHYYDVGIAVGASEGLVVPVLRDADRLSFAEIERGIKDFARKAQDHTLSLDDLRGGTFSITNGGVFGSLLSTPILNPPQVGILGLHRIQERPVSAGGQVVSRPMMYLALSYDHRVVDGLEAVQFLVRVKQLVEEPASLLLEG